MTGANKKTERAGVRLAYAPIVMTVLSLTMTIVTIGCGPSKPTAAELANKKRWEDWKKQNPSDPAVIQGAYQARQKQLAEKRAKSAKAKESSAAESSKHEMPPTATNPGGKTN